MFFWSQAPLAMLSVLYGAVKGLSRSEWAVGQTVNTTSGFIRGHGASNLTHVSEYLGIPYAEPPIGDLRFQPPVILARRDTLDASKFGPSCFASQVVTTTTPDPAEYANVTTTPIAEELLQAMLGATADQSEDCLTLNIWTKPQDGEKKKPVLVWVHGGGYTSGSSAVPWYNGQYLAGKEDLVVVTLNYRLSILGFPGNPVSPANLGLLDQRLALEWVRDNIAGFGGDPERITLFGQSAGGGSVDHYSYAWKSDPIVQAFILMSGTAAGFGLPSKRTAGDNWFNTTAACGCGNATDDPDRVYECMRAKPAVDIVTNITRVTVTDPITGLPFSPTVDEKYVFSNYIGRKPIAAPVMIGNTDLETGLFRLLQPTYPAVIWPLINDIAFDCPAAMRAAQSVLDGNPTWRYRWFGDFPNLALSTSPKSGSWHASDIPVLFNTTPTANIADTPDEEAIGTYLRGAYAAFARDPVNGLNAYGWPQYSTWDWTLVRLGYKNRTGPNLGIGGMYDLDCLGVPIVMSPKRKNGTTINETTGESGSTKAAPGLQDVGGKMEIRAGMGLLAFILTACVVVG